MMNGDTLHNPFTPFRHLLLPTSRPLRYTIPFLNRQYSSTSRCLEFLRFRRNPNFKFVRSRNSKSVELGTGLFMGSDKSDLPVEISYTKTLPPALTLEHGLIKIKEAVEKLKSVPPHSKSGVVRFQVAVPPNPKAWSWLCSQLEILKVFPQFYLSKTDQENPTLDPHLNNGVLGISGIGAAVYFTSSSSALRKWSSIKRYLSADSSLVRAYGLVGINSDVESSSMRHETGSFYCFIPQIELDEYGSTSLLAATLAWDDTSLCSFDNALCSLELSICQVIYQFLSSKEICQDKSISSTLKKPDLVEVEMAYIDIHSQVGEYDNANLSQLEGALTTYQFYFRLSPSTAFANNMLHNPSEMRCTVQCSVNMNAMWASLIIEECSRLGLTYFCIAPGSRSSPLAVAASTHPLTLCISCYDERSLAFHAVGYARGSGRPAIVITSSGTAVSNLLPAVVEASHDFVPLLLLTADRPQELHDVGANQAINQVNHFGSFVRYFFSLPPPTDDISARMVLTTIDSAVYWATNAPYGPVHINCPFREPLEGTPQEWKLSCLKGLDFWISRAEPFTKYIRMSHPQAACGIYGQIAQVIQLIQCAQKGLLLIGAIHSENEVWAALLLAKHLSWPIVADILSGLRLRKALTSFPGIYEKLLFVDHLDHALLSDSVRGWANPDVIVQIGGRITSKRICQMIEICSPCSYIMVDQHPYRHDPSHVVTHRIQSSITDFADCLLRVHIPRMTSKWRDFLHGLNKMVAWEIAFQIQTECSITEPHVAQVILEAIPNDAALFIGNSMVIRDADMYASGWVKPTTDISPIWPNLGLPCLGVRTAGNRGASGIDGLLSTSIGFAVGCNKRVFCMIGDISFLHDTNGLAMLNQRSSRKPMTIFVINNHGGAIFSLLPIADTTQQSVLNQYFYTSHNMSVRKLCEAHSVKYLQVRTKMELHHALMISEQANTDCIIEVESCIEGNASFHRTLRKFAGQAADHALSIISRISVPEHTSSGFFLCKILKMEYSLYRIQLSAPPTSSPVSDEPARFYREGFILSLYLEDGNVGFGEVAPLEIHQETLADVEEQIRFLVHVIQGAKMNYLLPLLKGSFSSWIWESLGLPPLSMFPSVRCGFEMAILNALAARQGCSLSNLLLGYKSSTPTTHVLEPEEVMKRSSGVQICALLDSNGTPEEVAHVAEELVKEGFTTIKLKVARRANPNEDVAVIQEVRRKVGHKVILRVDANRRWTYKEAIQFGSCVKYCDLQYIEEPVLVEDEIIKFCEETGLPVALDETIDNIQGDPLNRLAKFVHPGIVAIVIKPSVVGGFENAALIGKWAQQQNKMAVVSAAFESTLSLSTYIQFSHYLEEQHREIYRMEQKELRQPVAHGFGTYRWLREDVTETIKILGRPHNELVEASVEDADHVLRNFKINHKTIQRRYTGEQVRTYQVKVKHDDFSYSLKVQEVGIKEINKDVLVFLHGFLGTSEDWIPIMKALSASAHCISIDLPGHGESKIENHDNSNAKQESCMSIEVISNLLCKVIQDITCVRVVIVGYSMGARIALYMALRCCDQIDGAVVLSGSPGIKDVEVRRRRMAHDDARANFLSLQGLQFFLDTWYAGQLWDSLRAHPHFEQIFSSRMQHDDVQALAKTLSDLSIGRQPSLWEELKQCKKPLSFVVGEKDRKFRKIAKEMCNEIASNSRNTGDFSKGIHEMIEIPDCGHAVHLENPLSVISVVSQFLTKLE